MEGVITENKMQWFVCHTKPRCEKRFADLMIRQGFHHYLPLYESTKKYRHERTNRVHIKRFKKALFPSYVFCHIPLERKNEAYHEDYVVRLIPVEDEKRFLQQLEAVRALVNARVELKLCPPLEKGTPVRIADGPLMGLEAVVDDPENPKGIVVTVDILQQGVHARLPREQLEIIEES